MDHVLVKIDVPIKRVKSKAKNRRNYKKGDYHGMRNHLADATVQLNTWQKLKKCIKLLVEKFVPLIKKRSSDNQMPAASKGGAHENKRKKESLENIQKLSNSEKFYLNIKPNEMKLDLPHDRRHSHLKNKYHQKLKLIRKSSGVTYAKKLPQENQSPL